MKVLVLNCGSSSIKYQFFDTEKELVLAKGLVERIGMSDAILTHTRFDGDEIKIVGEILDHAIGVQYVLGVLLSRNHGVIEDKSEIEAVGHRVLHGGEYFKESILITDNVIKTLQDIIELGPLHLPVNIKGMEAVKRILPDVPQVAVFDTAFHMTMPPKAYLYGIPFELYKKYHLRKYGFHGTSHYFVSREAAKILGKDVKEIRMVTAHLGSGCSMAAVQNGATIDTTMGFTPLEGLLMGTRSGDLDCSVLLYIMGKEGISLNEANNLLNRHSGLLGVSGESSDMREVLAAAKEGHKRSQYAFDIFVYRVKKYIGSYTVAMGGLDALVFTGGIGENSPEVRAEVCKGLEFMGIEIDEQRNKNRETILSTDSSRIPVLRIPTNEELVIARDTNRIVEEMKTKKA
ncbi:MAG: acetate kinase [Ignavibacteriaceae bacterium]|nr:acetate kinase [Ignavibacteriaceae bacterium]